MTIFSEAVSDFQVILVSEMSMFCVLNGNDFNIKNFACLFSRLVLLLPAVLAVCEERSRLSRETRNKPVQHARKYLYRQDQEIKRPIEVETCFCYVESNPQSLVYLV